LEDYFSNQFIDFKDLLEYFGIKKPEIEVPTLS
jgi:hypothetical protein